MHKATILAMLAVITGFFVFYNPKLVAPPAKDQPPVVDTGQTWESKTDDQASITTTVTPTVLSTEADEWKFAVVMDTHSVELDQDMKSTAELVTTQGQAYAPLRWEGAPAGGHHREGVLVFAAPRPIPATITLNIKNLGGVPERSFTWTLPQ